MNHSAVKHLRRPDRLLAMLLLVIMLGAQLMKGGQTASLTPASGHAGAAHAAMDHPMPPSEQCGAANCCIEMCGQVLIATLSLVEVPASFNPIDTTRRDREAGAAAGIYRPPRSLS